MLRISKITDYGVLISSHMAALPSDEPRAVRDIASETGVPQPTTAKVLKLLARGGVVESHRGAHGGYRLARAPESITIAEVIEALEGPIAVTECTDEDASNACEHEGSCDVRANWQRINLAVQTALGAITLAEMARPLKPALVSLARDAAEAARIRGTGEGGEPSDALPTEG